MLAAECPQICHHGLGVFLSHAELRHGRPQAASVFPDSRGQQADHVLIARRESAGNARRFERPILNRHGGFEPDLGALEPVRAIGLSIAGARRVTLRAHRDVLDDVFAAVNFGLLSQRESATGQEKYAPNQGFHSQPIPQLGCARDGKSCHEEWPGGRRLSPNFVLSYLQFLDIRKSPRNGFSG